MRWTVALCGCNGTLPWDARAIQRALELAEPPALYQRLPRDEIHRLMDLLGKGGVERLAVACCGSADLFREVARAAGLDPARVEVVNLREGCFWTYPDRASGNAMAARLLRASLRGAEAGGERPDMPVRVGPTVLIATDSRAGIDLARRLSDVARPALLLDERSAALDAGPLHPLPWKATWGRLAEVEGSLGAFKVTIEREQPIDLGTCVHCMRCVPVCHTAAITPALRLRTELCDRCGDCVDACADVGAIRIPRADREVVLADQVVVLGGARAPGPSRTGYHALGSPAAGDLEALAWKVFGLVGEFRKPQYVRYDPGTCAGGAAGHQACGRCIPACPYHAIARDAGEPLRVRVDLAACEGCGACVAACPTSALTFTDPPAAERDLRLRALLAPVSGDGRGDPLVVAFHCPEKGAAALAEAARLRRPYRASVLPVPMACLRHVSDADVLAAFRYGAAGVALVGCESCPHGERELLPRTVELVRTFLEAFGLGGERVHVLTGEGVDLIEALDRFAASVAPSPVAWDGTAAAGTAGGREAVAETIRALVAATGRTPGRTRVPADAPFAFPDVHVRGCTLCRTCVNVCPTHAFRYDEAHQALELRQVACVNCGLCATACPERVITLRPETFLDPGALDYHVVVQDETLACVKCGMPFGNRRAVEVIESKVLGMAGLLDTFAGARRNLLRMCPKCRAVAAVMSMQEGWEP